MPVSPGMESLLEEGWLRSQVSQLHAQGRLSPTGEGWKKGESPHYSPALTHHLVSATGIVGRKLALHLDTGWRGNPVLLAVPERDFHPAELVGGREEAGL